MREDHLTDAELLDLLTDPAPTRITRERARVLAHFSDCPDCGERFNGVARFVSLLMEGDVWQPEAAGSKLPPPWLGRAAAALQQIAAERQGLDELLDTTLRGPRPGWRTRLASIDGLYTYAMVEAILDRADRLVRSAPADALELTAIAVETAAQLPVDAYPYDLVIALRARACREHAFSLSYAGRIVDALPLVDRAEELFRQTPLPAFELARVDVMRALIYRDMDRVDEAIGLTHQAAETFLSFGDRPRYVNAKLTEATLLFRRRRYPEARSIWSALEDEPSLQGTPAYGMLLQHLGSSYRELHDFSRARDYYARAMAEHRKHGLVTDELRVQWSLGLTLMAEQKQREALPILRRTWRGLTELQLADDAALVGLKVAEVLLMLDRPAEVAAICRTLLDHFTRNRSKSAAVTALSYLREAVAAGKAKPALVSEIHDFIRDLPRHPGHAYTP
jgi:tetratricopeptide (TPR) repeat protein